MKKLTRLQWVVKEIKDLEGNIPYSSQPDMLVDQIRELEAELITLSHRRKPGRPSSGLIYTNLNLKLHQFDLDKFAKLKKLTGNGNIALWRNMVDLTLDILQKGVK